MYCQNCHAEISPSHTHCPVCKQPVKAVHTNCPNCSADLEPDTVSCKNCGYHLLLKKVIKLHDMEDAPAPQTTVICPSCKKEIPISSHFCEFCGSDIHVAVPSAAPSGSSQKSSTGAKDTGTDVVGFNEATFNSLIRMLDEKGIISIKDLQNQMSQ